MQYQDEREQIVRLGRSLFDRGYAFGSSGNISVRVETGYLVTPTNYSLGELNAEALTLLDPEWTYVSGEQPTKEVPMHRAFYDAKDSNAAVVHLHSTHATAVSCLLTNSVWDLPYITPYMVMRLGVSIGVVPYLRPGHPGLEVEISGQAAESSAVLLKNHGLATAGRTLAAAAVAAEELEEAAKLYLLLGNREYDALSSADVEELLNHR